MITDTKYVNLISNRVERFTKKGPGLWNFRCPLCGDSKKDRTKARGFVYSKQNHLLYRCHNCHASISLGSLIKAIDPLLYNEYALEAFKETHADTIRPVYTKSNPTADIGKFQQPKFIKFTALGNIKKISQLDPSHPAKKYVLGRQIPTKLHSQLFYAPKFKKWVNSIVPGRFDNTDADEPRLIIPLIDQRKNLFGFQGRAFGPSKLRYITIMLDDDALKVYGMDRVDKAEKVIVTEGPIDSMFLNNAIAMVGSSAKLKDLPIRPEKLVVVYDNEPRNKEIVREIEHTIDQGFAVCIWPEHVTEKDVNDMVLAGRHPVDIQRTIEQNTYSGLSAKMRMVSWKKI